MSKSGLLTIILSIISYLSFAQTNVSGGIYQNATWSLAGSPYIVNGPVVVFPGVTLNIQPGEGLNPRSILQLYLHSKIENNTV
jgi:hypothetical protein